MDVFALRAVALDFFGGSLQYLVSVRPKAEDWDVRILEFFFIARVNIKSVDRQERERDTGTYSSTRAVRLDAVGLDAVALYFFGGVLR